MTKNVLIIMLLLISLTSLVRGYQQSDILANQYEIIKSQQQTNANQQGIIDKQNQELASARYMEKLWFEKIKDYEELYGPLEIHGKLTLKETQ